MSATHTVVVAGEQHEVSLDYGVTAEMLDSVDTGAELDSYSDLDQVSDDFADNGNQRVYQWAIGQTPDGRDAWLYVWTDQGVIDYVGVDTDDLGNHIMHASYDVTDAEWAVLWDIDPMLYLDVVDNNEDCDSPCRVWITYNYYEGTSGAPMDGYATEQDHSSRDFGQVLEFDSAAEARAWIAENDTDGVYSLAHGEYARPEYTVVKA